MVAREVFLFFTILEVTDAKSGFDFLFFSVFTLSVSGEGLFSATSREDYESKFGSDWSGIVRDKFFRDNIVGN